MVPHCSVTWQRLYYPETMKTVLLGLAQRPLKGRTYYLVAGEYSHSRPPVISPFRGYLSCLAQDHTSSWVVQRHDLLAPLWPNCFIPSEALSNCLPLFPSSTLDTFSPGSGGLIFRCHIFLPFYTDHGLLMARVLEWFSIPSSSVLKS